MLVKGTEKIGQLGRFENGRKAQRPGLPNALPGELVAALLHALHYNLLVGGEGDTSRIEDVQQSTTHSLVGFHVPLRYLARFGSHDDDLNLLPRIERVIKLTVVSVKRSLRFSRMTTVAATARIQRGKKD